MILWWLSWCQPGDDWSPIDWPPPAPILAVWCTGYGDDYATVVALVRAETPDAARAAVRLPGAWPDAGDERFCEPKLKEPGTRFPRPTEPEMASRWPWPVAEALALEGAEILADVTGRG